MHTCGWRRCSTGMDVEKMVVSDRQGLILYDVRYLVITVKELVFINVTN
jgi:hypothetical protein